MTEHDGAPRRLPPRRWVTIQEIERLTPRVVRIRVQGDDLADFAVDGPGAHIKLILPLPGVAEPTLPLRYEGGSPVFDEGVVPPFLRTYTPLRFDAAKRELEVELLLHGDGLASNWAQRAKVGDEIVVAGPRGGWAVPDDGDWYLVLADETAIPAASTVLEALAGRRCVAAFEVADRAECREVGNGVDTSWLFRGPDSAMAGRPLETFVREFVFPPGRGYAWVACEAAAMRRIRRFLLDERGMDPGQMVTRGYWKLGASDHPDGDYGLD